MKRTGLMVIACLLGAVSPSVAQESLRCDDLFDRPALLQEHVQCASGYSGEQLTLFFRTTVWPNTYETLVSDLPSEELRQVAAGMGLKAGDHVPVVAKPKPSWLKTKWHFEQSSTSPHGPAIPLACIVGPGRGHAEFAHDAAKAQKWGDSATSLLALAAIDADDFEWENLAAHAQTPTGDTSPGPPATTAAIAAFDAWLKLNTERLASECAQGRFGPAIYVTGYVLHATQDLALHSGITRAEQAALVAAANSPELDSKRVGLAADWTKRTLKQLEAALPAACVSGMKSYSAAGASSLRPAGVDTQYFGKRDRTAAAMAKFKSLGAGQAQAGTESAAWFQASNKVAANAFYEAHVRAVLASTLSH
jgi:hypothetical protein